MKSAFLPRLVNGPFGDPGLYVGLRWLGRAVQFDLGSLDRFPGASLLKLSHLFVSHTHLDHFIGFDRVLRLFLNRAATLDVYGPQGIIDNVRGKLAGYTWNLVDGYEFALRVHEVLPDRVRSVELPATDAFQPQPARERPFAGVLHDEATFRVECVHLDHRIPNLAFALCETTHLNVRTDALERLGLLAGPWLNQLKSALRSGQVPETRMRATLQDPRGGVVESTIGELADQLIVETPGQRLVYVVDTLFSRRNVERLLQLAHGADLLFCESLFLDQDRHEALKRYHLTARQAGTIARLAQVKQLQTFHYSPRYEGRGDLLAEEAGAAFRGEIEADDPI